MLRQKSLSPRGVSRAHVLPNLLPLTHPAWGCCCERFDHRGNIWFFLLLKDLLGLCNSKRHISRHQPVQTSQNRVFFKSALFPHHDADKGICTGLGAPAQRQGPSQAGAKTCWQIKRPSAIVQTKTKEKEKASPSACMLASELLLAGRKTLLPFRGRGDLLCQGGSVE